VDLQVDLHTTEIRTPEANFAEEMTRMRTWLDSRRFEPAVFRYDHVAGAVVIRVDFTVEQEAAAFAREFGGQLLR
jgi:hypothetical protein